MTLYTRVGMFVLVLAAVVACSGEIGTGADANSDPMDASKAAEEVAPTEMPESTEVICPEESPHPIAEDIAGTFDVSYGRVEDWFCSGIPFDEILLALQTQKIIDVDVEHLFNERMQGKTWDQIWNELEITRP